MFPKDGSENVFGGSAILLPKHNCRICCVQCSLKRISYIFPTKDTTGISRHTVQFLRNQIYGSLVRVNQHAAKKDYTST